MVNIILEMFMRAIPEVALFLYGIHVFSKSKIETKGYLKSILILSPAILLYERLPLHYGGHMLLGMISLIFAGVAFNKIDLIKVVPATIATLMLEILSEGVNILVMKYGFHMDLTIIFQNVFLKCLYSIPSLVITFIVLKFIRNRMLAIDAVN